MKPSPEAAAWGKRQASKSPRWTDAKWRRIQTIFGVELTTPEVPDDRYEAEAATWQDAA
ncbi:hypothetical protein ACLQ2P_22695 [Actinomadura citrea]|uniref:hypothetical protein n=1 Tax=Actinomadura citrea TaxID=46158 RepID=UPI003CE47FDB